jgi:hypothetical protein
MCANQHVPVKSRANEEKIEFDPLITHVWITRVYRSGEGEPYMSEYEGELFVYLDDEDEPHLAGHAKLFILNADAAENDEDAPPLFDLLDMRGESAACWI